MFRVIKKINIGEQVFRIYEKTEKYIYFCSLELRKRLHLLQTNRQAY